MIIRVRAHSYTNKFGRTVYVREHTRTSKGRVALPAHAERRARRPAVPAPAARPRKPRSGASIKVSVPIHTPGTRIKRAVSLKGEKRRYTQKHATRNLVKRQARKQVRKAVPGFRAVRVSRRRKKR